MHVSTLERYDLLIPDIVSLIVYHRLLTYVSLPLPPPPSLPISPLPPSQTQLELYRAERRCLLEQSEGTRAELERLAGQYSQLLGHQNKKQKIHHIMQLKEENLQLKKVRWLRW